MSFASVMRLERAAATNFVDGLRAQFLAEAGMARAVSELQESILAKPHSDPGDPWYFGADPTVLVADVDPANASFYAELGRSYPDGRDDYTVKVLDCQGQLNVNDRYPSLSRFLDQLGVAVGRTRGRDPISGRGAAIVAARDALPGGRFLTKGGLERTLETVLGADDAQLITHYLTVDSWRDQSAVVATAPGDPQNVTAPPQLELQGRSPINVNTASVEVLEAVLTGIAGRATYSLPARITQEEINSGTGTPWNDYLEETSYGIQHHAVFMGPLDPQDANEIAAAIVANRPFRSAWAFEAFVNDTADIDNWFSRTNLDVPGAVGARIDQRTLRLEVGGSMLAANFNPTGAARRWNPNQTQARRVDKASLFGVDGQPTQSPEFCYGSRGSFEIASIGRVRLADDVLVAEAELRTIVDLLHIGRVSSQSEFEAATSAQSQTVSYPDNVRLTGPGTEVSGWLELEPFSRASNPGAEVGALEGPGGAPLSPVFGAYYETAQGGGRGNLAATQSSPSATPAARGGLASAERGRVSEGTSRINPDGVNHDGLAPQMLRYRAASPADDDSQGESDFDGNVNMISGALEFWYKPSFDWTVGGQASPVVCGLIFAGHVQSNVFVDPPTQSTGCQMFLLRNASGDLRVLRIYYEVVGSGPGETPLVQDPLNGEWITVEEYVRRANNDIVTTVDTTVTETDTTITTTTVTTRSVGSNYPWPPAQIPVEPDIQFARREVVVPYAALRHWQAHEWHHIALVWDDADAGATGLRIFVDGEDRGSTPYVLPGTPGEQLFCKLNQNPGDNRDCFYVGGIDRPQQGAGGAFKFEQLVAQPANGTVDDVRTFDHQAGIRTVEPERYPQEGRRSLNFAIPTAFGGAGQLAWIGGEGYLPQSFGTLQAPLFSATGSGSIGLNASSAGGQAGEGGWQLSTTWTTLDQSLVLSPAPGEQLVVAPGDQIQVDVLLSPAQFDTGFNRDSPVLNELTVAVFRPTPQVREKLWR